MTSSDLDLVRDFAEKIKDQWWRLTSGCLYKIVDADGNLVPFKPYGVQLKFLRELHFRNIVPKARQRGFSTVFQIYMLDTALFRPNMKCLVNAHKVDAAADIYNSKFVLPYDNLPQIIKDQVKVVRKTTTEMEFSNGSSVSVSTSGRSGTINVLHVSELGVLAVNNPEKAKEIMTGSIPAVPPSGIICIESTSKGRDGIFYEKVETARKLQLSGAKLTPLDYKLHFASWWDADRYRLEDHASVVITPALHDYFDRKEREHGIVIDESRRAWYAKTLEDFGGDTEIMWQEYPTDIDEPFAVSTEGTYYAEQLKAARTAGRIGLFPHNPALPVDTWWDIGHTDLTSIWFTQQDGAYFNVIDFLEAAEEPYEWFVKELQKRQYLWAVHWLPHDADHTRQQGIKNASPKDMLQELAPGWRFEIVARIKETLHGIQQTQQLFSLLRFDEAHTKDGLRHIELYRKTWNRSLGQWEADSPRHDTHSNAADALRAWGQARASGLYERIRNSRGRPAHARQQQSRREYAYS